MPDITVRKGRAPVEMGAVGAAALAILFVIAAGTGLASILPDPTPWLVAAAYLAPAGLAFTAYWWAAQKL
jgi:hypothetical protein